MGPRPHVAQALVKRARYGDDLHDMDAALAGNIAAKRRYKGNELDVDDEYDHDGGLEMCVRAFGVWGLRVAAWRRV